MDGCCNHTHFVSGLRGVERGLPLHIQTESERLCFDKAAFITGWLCSSSSLSLLSHPETLHQLSGSRGEFNPVITAADQSGGL